MFTATVMGVLSHYHYLIFAFFVSACILIYLCYKREWKLAGKYSATMAVAVMVSFAIFPKALQVVKGGHTTKVAPLERFISLLNHDLFGDKLWIFCLGVCLLCLAKLFFIFFSLNISNKNNTIFVEIEKTDYFKVFQNNVSFCFSINESFLIWPMLTLSLLLTFLVVSRTIWIYESRYFYNQYPIIIILVTGIIYALSCNMKRGKTILIAFFVVLFLCNISMYSRRNIKFYNLDQLTVQKITEEVGKIPVIAITDRRGWWPLSSQFIVFSKCSETYITEDKNINCIIATVADKESPHGMLMYISFTSKIDKNSLFKSIKHEANITSIEQIGSNHGHLYWMKR